MNYKTQKTIDSHVHIYTTSDVDYFIDYRKRHNFDKVNVACLCNLTKQMEADPTQNILAAILKLRDDHFYAHFGLCYPSFPVSEKYEYDFASQIELCHKIGFDGMKMLEAKPTVNKLIGVGVDHPVFDGVYEYAQANDIHIVSHVADPETFWDKDKAPEFSFKEGWFYGDGTFATKEALYLATENVLQKYPRIRFTFPHFYFLSDDLARARDFLLAHPLVDFDFTPGREMYDNFTRHHEEASQLIYDFAGRFMFGTDNNTRFSQGNEEALIDSVKRFLCTDDYWHDAWGFDIKGVNLPKEKSKLILSQNFEKKVGSTPRPINKHYLGLYIEKYAKDITNKQAKDFIFDFANNSL